MLEDFSIFVKKKTGLQLKSWASFLAILANSISALLATMIPSNASLIDQKYECKKDLESGFAIAVIVLAAMSALLSLAKLFV